MKNILFHFILLLFLNTTLFAANFSSYPPALHAPITKLLSFPKANQLLHNVEKKRGKIKVQLKSFSFSTQNAMWNPKGRSIILHPQRKRHEGEVIRLILFELHNAKNQDKFHKVDMLANRGRIDRESYIRAIEYIEYENVMETVALINEGIRQGYYPQNAYWKVHADFEKHYALQKQAGHSQFIGQTYDKITATFGA